MAGDYTAPAGSYGNVSLATATPLQHSGVRDRNFCQRASRGERRSALTLFAKYERYSADDAGFGYVPPTLIGSDPTRIEITYPAQQFGKLSAGLHAQSLGMSVADRLDVTVYRQRNERDLTQHIFAYFGPGTPAGAGVDIAASNFTEHPLHGNARRGEQGDESRDRHVRRGLLP